jgi:hypothetical protein
MQHKDVMLQLIGMNREVVVSESKALTVATRDGILVPVLSPPPGDEITLDKIERIAI